MSMWLGTNKGSLGAVDARTGFVCKKVVRRHALKINTLSLEHDHGTSGLEHDHGTSGRPRPSSSPPCSSRPWRLRRSCALTARARSPAWSPATSPGNDEAGPKLTKKTDEIVSSRPRS